MQRDAGVPSVIVWVVEALLILLLAALQIRLQSRLPATSEAVPIKSTPFCMVSRSDSAEKR